MDIAIICSNYFDIKKETPNGTAIFAYSFITELVQHAKDESLSITAFASGASELPVPVISIDHAPSSADESLVASGKNVLYEQTLLARAFAMQEQFDVYHVNIGDGDIALPFSSFVDRPIIVTLHHILDTDYMRRYFSFYRKQKNVFFVSASDAQRKLLPDLNYIATIYHGVDLQDFSFDEAGGERLMWAGRVIPEKGADIVVDAARTLGRGVKLFGIPRKAHQAWLKEKVLDHLGGEGAHEISFQAGLDRHALISEYQKSKAFVFPVSYEESFGFVLAEAMSCGTPVVAFARGSIPEIIEDGKTGFIVNASEADIRGEWTIKQTGAAGLREAIERIYALPADEYKKMRRDCRERATQHFSIERMTKEYVQTYRRVVEKLTSAD